MNSLFLGHHEDDRAETILLRIIASQTGSGLRGVQAVARIPECYGIYGVHDSGDTVSPADLASRSSITRVGLDKTFFGIASGGIIIYRPLLNFPKIRLVATCRTNTVRWYEDETNADKTSTVRNTIRHLMEKESLPIAVRKQRLLRVSSVTRDALAVHDERVQRVLERIEVLNLDIRSGMLIFRPPSDLCSTGERSNLLRIACSVLGLLASAVSPDEHVSINDFANLAPNIFTDLAMGHKDHVKNAFTVAGSMWNMVPNGSKYGCEGRSIWRIYRQPYTTSITKPKCLWAAEERTILPKRAQSFDVWQLFDGRYWLNVSSRDSRSIIARPFEHSDLYRLRMKLSEVDRKALELQLAECAPEKVRWTLPVLADAVTNCLLALPTLGVHVHPLEHDLRWRVEYKHTELVNVNVRSDPTGATP